LQFRKDNAAWLEEFTLFRTLVDAHDGNTCWPSWQEEYREYTSAIKAVSKGALKAKFEEQQTFWAFVQWVAWSQWGDIKALADKKAVALMGDLPFGVSRYSADVWAHPELFDLKWSCGAPPKPTSKETYSSRSGDRTGACLTTMGSACKRKLQMVETTSSIHHEIISLLPIDHVLGFFRVYAFPWIPERNGEFIDLTKETGEEIDRGGPAALQTA